MVLFIFFVGPIAGQHEHPSAGTDPPTNEEIEVLLAEADQMLVTISQGLQEFEIPEKAWELAGSGDLEGAIALIHESLNSARARGDTAAVALGLETLGAMLSTLGDTAGALEAYEKLEALALAAEDPVQSKAILARACYFLAASRMHDDLRNAETGC